jgi:uncharacterized protein (UPF0332 family)
MTPEVAALLHKARESQQAAILLDGANFREFAAARAYYAMFYAAQALLLERGLTFSSHAAVIAAFGREFAKANLLDPKLRRYLLDAQDLRNVGDYGIERPISAAQVQEILAWSDEFISTAERFLKSEKSG